jgi:rubrerythrin
MASERGGMMDDLISKSALIEKLRKDRKSVYSHVFCHTDSEHEEALAIDLEQMINNQPTVDAVPVVHGEWIKKLRSNGGYIASITCSVCGCSWHRVTYNFCPECGADMRKDGANNV